MAERAGPDASCISPSMPTPGEIVAGMLTDNVADNAGQVPALPGHHAAGNSYSGDHSECSGSRCGSDMP